MHLIAAHFVPAKPAFTLFYVTRRTFSIVFVVPCSTTQLNDLSGSLKERRSFKTKGMSLLTTKAGCFTKFYQPTKHMFVLSGATPVGSYIKPFFETLQFRFQGDAFFVNTYKPPVIQGGASLNSLKTIFLRQVLNQLIHQ